MTANSVTAILLAIAAFFASSSTAGANPAQPTQNRRFSPNQVRSAFGLLLLKNGNELRSTRRGSAPTIDLTVSGPTIRARVTQIFHNPTKNWVEAVYVYPLPEGGAVDTLKMVVGDRIVVGEIKEREEARAHLRGRPRPPARRRR